MSKEKYISSKNILKLNSDSFTQSELKHSYIKIALKCHPDKNKGSEESTKQFQELKEAYEYMMNYTTDSSYYCNDYRNPLFSCEQEAEKGEEDRLYSFVTDLIKGKYSNIIMDILCGIKIISLTVFEKMTKKQLSSIYNFLQTYKSTFFISEELLQEIKEILEIKETKRELCYTISPTVTDLLEDKVYKLSLENKTYLIPLWHNEIYYEGVTDEQEIVITCEPNIPDNMYIDNSNNLFVKISILLNSELLTNEKYSFFIGKKKYDLPVNELFITPKCQTIHLGDIGILKINESNVYDTSLRGNIFVIVELI
jgi:hypothetical protein